MFRNHVKPFVVACVTALVIAMLALAAFATKAGTTAAEPTIVRQGLTGTVTGSGHITVNGQVAQSGARITNGSVITTDADADALVDLGVLGQITLRPNTSIKVLLAQDSCQVMMENCGSFTQVVPQGVSSEVQMDAPKQAQVISDRGNLWVSVGDSQNNSRKPLASGKHRTFSQARSIIVDGSNKGETRYTVNCCQCCFVDKVNP